MKALRMPSSYQNGVTADRTSLVTCCGYDTIITGVRFILPMSKHWILPAIVSAVLVAGLSAGLMLPDHELRADLSGSPSCEEICGGAGAQYQLCMDGCTGTGGQGAGSEGSEGDDSMMDFFDSFGTSSQGSGAQSSAPPASASAASSQPSVSGGGSGTPSAATGDCPAQSFRKEDTGFCILAGRCRATDLLRLGFVRDDQCEHPVDFTSVYGRRVAGSGNAASGNNIQGIDLGDLTSRAIAMMDDLLARIPQGSLAAVPVRDMRQYLTVLLGNISARTLTPLETEATSQYLASRLTYLMGTLKQNRIPFDDQQELKIAKRREVEEGLRSMVYGVLPDFFERLISLNVPGLDLQGARTLHTQAAASLDAAGNSCGQDPGTPACDTDLQHVLAFLLNLEPLLRPRLEQTENFDILEKSFTLAAQAAQGTSAPTGFPKPFIGN